MTVFVEESHAFPLVTIEAVVPRGAVADAIGQEGLARHASELMRRGAGDRDRAALDAALDALGASIDVSASQDQVAFSVHGLSRQLEPLVALLGDVLARPRLEPGEHERLRRESLATLDDIRDDDATLAHRFFERAVLPGHPYGRTALGTEPSLSALSQGDATAWVAANLRAGHVLWGFAGDVTAAAAHDAARRLASALPGGDGPARPVLPDPAFAPARRTVLVDKPERTQSQIVIGHPGPPEMHADWLALHVAATAFGGTFTSRLMTEVRVKRGWSYSASARLARARGGHTFRMRVFPSAEQTPQTLALVHELFESVAAAGLRPDEIALAKNYLEGSWAFDIDTPAERLGHSLDTVVLELAPDAYTRFVDRLRAIDIDQVNAAIRRWWRPASTITTLVATAETMLPALASVPTGPIDVLRYDSY